MVLIMRWIVAVGIVCSIGPSVHAGDRMAGQTATGAIEKIVGWNMTFRLPLGWQVSRREGRMLVLTSDSSAGKIFLAPGIYQNGQQVMADATRLAQFLNLRGRPIDPPAEKTIAGKRGFTATYALQDQQMKAVKSRLFALFSDHDTGLSMSVIATPDEFQKLQSTLENIAGTVTMRSPEFDSQAVAALAGTWEYYSGASSPNIANSGSSSRSHQETVFFDGRGSYSWHSASHVSVDSRVTLGGYSGGVSNFSEDQDQGTYRVIGNTIIVRGDKGQFVYDYQLQGNQLVADGRDYIRK